MTGWLLPQGVTHFEFFALVFASFLTSGLTAAVGIGGGLLMLALLAYVLPPLVLIPFHGVVQLGSNAGRSWTQRRHIDWPVALPFLAGCLIGAGLGAMLFVQLDEQVLRTILAAFILAMTWLKLPPLQRSGSGAIAFGGLATTFASMFVGATGPLAAVFLKNFYQNRLPLVATHAVAMTAQHGFKVAAFLVAGWAFLPWLPLLVTMIATGYLGTLAGTRLLNRLPEETFRLLFKITLTLVALDLLRRAVLPMWTG